MACQLSESGGEGIAGCLFYTLQADNVTADENATTSFLVANAGQARANVKLEAAQAGSGGTGWATLGEFQVEVGASGRIPISPVSPSQVTGVLAAPQVRAAGVTKKAALRISSDQPVTVSQIESDNVDSPATSSGGTMLLPLQSLNTDHRVITYAQAPTNDVQMTAGSRGGSARVMVVGTADGTTVKFTPVTPVTGDPSGDPPDLAAGVPHTVMLDDGDVFQIYSGAMGEDLTGAEVWASARVAVFAGNISTTYGYNVTGINSADMAHEQMPPLSSWSKSYVAAAMTPQASIGCTSFFGMDGASIWRVIASQDGT
ncbi:MAG TPA: IgGFc-binding protein, partial [Polyangia bacterium]|nr:IgGFc-binding protein [Polyangia bacterium]